MILKRHAAFTLHMCITIHELKICTEGPALAFLLAKFEAEALGILGRVFGVGFVGRIRGNWKRNKLSPKSLFWKNIKAARRLKKSSRKRAY
jgi:hypothetical protein